MGSREQAVRVADSGATRWKSILILVNMRILILPLHLLLHVLELLLLLLLLDCSWISHNALLALTRLADDNLVRRQHHLGVSG